MIDKKIVFAGPVGTRSGYGARSRDICKSLISLGYDLKIVPLLWGTTPTDALDQKNDAEIIKRLHSGNLETQPDIFIHCVIPNEFQAIGKYNIGITAGIETDNCAAEWIEGCNRMDLILTSSEHSKRIFETVQYQKRDKQTNQVVSVIKCEKPVRVLFEGIDDSVYKKIDVKHFKTDVKKTIDALPESFAYLFVGHWLQGELGHDRKDVGMLVHTFMRTFANYPKGKKPALILKASMAGFSLIEREAMENKINQIQQMVKEKGVTGDLPSVYLLYGDLSDEEMNELYNHPKVKAMVSFTKGEGFGRPLLEFTTTGKPVIASNWSGQLDFLNSDYAYLLPGGLNTVHESSVNQWILKDSKWFTVNYSFAAKILENCYNAYQTAVKKCTPQLAYTLDNFTIEKMTSKLKEFLETDTTPVISETPVKKLVLPKLNKK
jgi:glycosyltransferase involved in cell wall biosynthesis